MTATKTVTVDGVPAGEGVEQVLRMASAAKSLAFFSGLEAQPDDLYIRAAQCVSEALRDREHPLPCDLLVALIASCFDAAQDVGEARVEFLCSELPDPSIGLAKAVRQNRRNLGLSDGPERGVDRG